MASFTLAAGSLSSVKNVARSASLSAPQAARAAPVSLAIRAVAAKDVRALGTEEINTTIDGLKRELFDLRMKQATRQVRRLPTLGGPAARTGGTLTTYTPTIPSPPPQEVKNSQFSIIRKDVSAPVPPNRTMPPPRAGNGERGVPGGAETPLALAPCGRGCVIRRLAGHTGMGLPGVPGPRPTWRAHAPCRPAPPPRPAPPGS
mmetsp:Transcript_61878/g.195524  ORF Transcript_61878/g.195524 Transcript_61878/m.195524 type:complete len:203 (-) Transcript_61878:453-1061(-)